MMSRRLFGLIVAAAASLAAAVVPGTADDTLAKLLALEDARRLDAPAFHALARHVDPLVRARTARALAATADPRAVILLARLARDREAAVRAAAAEGAGRLAGRDPGLREAKATRIVAALLDRLLDDSDPAVRAAAAWGSGAGGLAAAEESLLRRLRREKDAGVRAAALQELWRVPGASWFQAAASALSDGEGRVRLAAAWSLARSGKKEAARGLERAARDEDPLVRAVALDGIRRGTQSSAWDIALQAVGDADERVRIAALLALAALLDEPDGERRRAALEGMVPDLVRDADPRRVHLRVAAIRLAGAAGCCGEQLAAAVAAGEPWVSGEAIEALARGGAREAGPLVGEWLADARVERRTAAARAAAFLPDGRARLIAMLADPAAPVRLAAVDRLGTLPAVEAVSPVKSLLRDSDPAVRAAAVETLAAMAKAGIAGTSLATRALLDLLAKESGAVMPDAAVALVDALAAATTLPPEATRALQGLARGGEPVVARAAWAALVRHGVTSPLPAVAGDREPAHYERVVAWAAHERWLEIVTWRGTILLRLDTARAPLTCFRLVELVERKFFDGLTFHRVVPDFVAQGGDPRGDGWGGPGFTLRDELSLAPYEAGVVGLAHSGPDTAGSQFFVTLTPQPHLTGRYPVIGTVVEGFDVAARLRVGDRIVRLRAADNRPPVANPIAYGALDAARIAAEIPHWREEREAYAPEEPWLAHLRTARLRYELHVAMGTWCGDSREQIPRLEKVLEVLGAASPFEPPRLLGIDRSKATDPAVWPFGPVELVPTIVVTAGGAELGRIVESPASGRVEEDLARILAPIEGWQLPEPTAKESQE